MFPWQPPPPIKIKAVPEPGYYVIATGEQEGVAINEKAKHFGILSLARKHAYQLVQQFLDQSEDIAGMDYEIQIVLTDVNGTISLIDAISLLIDRVRFSFKGSST